MYQLCISIILHLGCTGGPKAVPTVCPQISAETITSTARISHLQLNSFDEVKQLQAEIQKSVGVRKKQYPNLLIWWLFPLWNKRGSLSNDRSKCQPVAAQGLQGSPHWGSEI